MIKVYRTEPTKETLKEIYDVCNRIFKDKKYFYTKEEAKDLKKDKSNVFLS